MKKNDFIYKHITKLPWILTSLYTLIGASVFFSNRNISYLSQVISIYAFSFVWYLIFQMGDNYAVKYRIRVLHKTPELWEAVKRNKIEELEKMVDGDK